MKVLALERNFKLFALRKFIIIIVVTCIVIWNDVMVKDNFEEENFEVGCEVLILAAKDSLSCTVLFVCYYFMYRLHIFVYY